MRKLLTIAGLFLAGLTASAQANVESGTIRLNAGGGVSDLGVMGYFGADFGVADKITVGGELSLRHRSHSNWKHTGFGFITNGNYHFGEHIKALPSELGLYGGLSLGYYNWSSDWEGSGVRTTFSDYDSGIVFLAQAGARWFFSKNWAVNAELHAGSFYGAKAGMTYQF